MQGAACSEIGLPKISSAEVAICKTKNIYQRAEDILLFIEVKVSVVMILPKGAAWLMVVHRTCQGIVGSAIRFFSSPVTYYMVPDTLIYVQGTMPFGRNLSNE